VPEPRQLTTVFLLIVAAHGAMLSAQDKAFSPALQSGSLPSPAIHSRDQIRQRLAALDGLIPGPPYLKEPHITAPYAAGSLTAQYVAYGMATLNAFRYLAGLPDAVPADPAWNEAAQYGAALLAIINKGIDHTPAFPAAIGMPRAFYDKGYAGTSTSNLTQGPADLAASVKGFMDDSDPGNIDRLGHRRWVLSPSLDKVGFGNVKDYFVLKVFSTDGQSTGQSYSYVAWPAVGDQPLGWFGADQAWSFSLDPKAFPGGLKGSRAGITVKVKRQRNNREWSFSANHSDGYFNVETSGFGLPFCVIFKPEAIGTLWDGDLFYVSIGGISDGRGNAIRISYDTAFFASGPAVTIGIASTRPARRTVHAASQSQGTSLEAAREKNGQANMGYIGPALTRFSWYVDSPDGILPIGIEINKDGIIHGPGETITAPPGGITHVRLISTEPGLQYACYSHSKGWTRWGKAGDTIGFDDGTPIETISIDLGE
jgi:hypothetical protein